MSGINDVLKGDGCVLKKWVCRSQLCFVLCVCVCVCVSLYFLIVFYLRCRTTWDAALPFCPVIWNAWRDGSSSSVKLFFMRSQPTLCDQTTWTPPSLAQPCLHKAYISSTQRQCLLSEVTARPWRLAPQLNDHPIWPVSFLHPPLFFFSTSPLFLSVCLCLSPLKERNICSRPKGVTLNTSSF